MKYYDYNRTLNKKDINGNEPLLYLITSNRSAGKSFGCQDLLLSDFIEKGKEFCIFYRYKYELSSAHLIFEGNLKNNEKFGKELTSESHAEGTFYELKLDGKRCGFAVALNSTDTLKKYSNIFSNVWNILFDEFQLENGSYMKNEIDKFLSALMTVSRGGGEQSRKVRVFMLGNYITMLNPYFLKLGIFKRANKDKHFLRGDGWICHFDVNESASKAISDNPIFNSFHDSDYFESSTNASFLRDTDCFCENITGKNKYMCTFIYNGLEIGVRDFYEKDVIFFNSKVDKNCNLRLVFNSQEHNNDTVFARRYRFLLKQFIELYDSGLLRFENIEIKNAIFLILGIAKYDKM